MDWTRVVVKQALMNEQIHNPKRRLENAKGCVRNNVFLCAFIL
jgi:hypothetical protein